MQFHHPGFHFLNKILFICFLNVWIFEFSFGRQIVLNDSFDDQNLTENPVWMGDIEKFTFFDDNGNFRLRSNAGEAGNTLLYTPSHTAYGTWEFYIDQDFPPSNSNRTFIFLISDISSLDGNVNGYAIRTGESSSPNFFRLFRVDNGNHSEILTGTLDISDGGPYQVRITRDENGTWELFESAGFGSESISAGTATDNSYTSSNYFGMLLNYTSTRTDRFFFDEILIENTADFAISSVTVTSETSLEVSFNFPPDESTVDVSDFTINQNFGSPDHIQLKSDYTVQLTYNTPIPEDSYTLTVSNISNRFGEVIEPDSRLDFSIQNPFKITGISVINNSQIKIEFSREVGPEFLDPSNFIIENWGQPGAADQISPGVIQLSFNPPLESGEYQLVPDRIKSTTGWSLGGQSTFTIFIFDDHRAGDIIINEFFYRVPAEWRTAGYDRPQYAELFNQSTRNINLKGWSINGAIISVNEDLLIAPQEYMVISRGKPVFIQQFGNQNFYEADQFPVLNMTTSNEIVLKSDESVTSDSLYYEAGTWGGDGVALERKDPAALSIDPSNWAPAPAGPKGTPGEVNSRFEPDTTPPFIKFAHLVHPDSVSVLFSEYVNLSDTQNPVKSIGITLSSARFILNGIETSVLKYLPGKADRLILDASGVQTGSKNIIQIENLIDYQGNSSATQEFTVAMPPEPGDLVINEILFDPIADNLDHLPDQSEYIELYNRRPYPVSLEGIFIHDTPDENYNISKMEPVTTMSKWIPAHGYSLLYPESGSAGFTESRVASFFGLEMEEDLYSLQFDRITLGLTGTGREIYLSDSLQTVIDMAAYSPDWHNPNLIDTKGIALERINPGLDTNDPLNWGSNTSITGGSPMAENSLSQQSGDLPSGSGITISPNPFSPDADGFDDSLFINYTFSEPDYLLRIRLFDRYGRLVRKLAESHPAGFEGSVIWDGRMDNGQNNRIGIYIVLVEAYNSSNGKGQTFRETVVIARQF